MSEERAAMMTREHCRPRGSIELMGGPSIVALPIGETAKEYYVTSIAGDFSIKDLGGF